MGDISMNTDDNRATPPLRPVRCAGRATNSLDTRNWTQILPNVQVNSLYFPPQFQPQPGIKTLLHPGDPIDYFHAFFLTGIFRLMAEETNNYALQYFDDPSIDELPANSRFRSWLNADENDLRKFLALEIGMGLCSKNRIADYWETYWLTKTPSYRQVMTRDRYFNQIVSTFQQQCYTAS